MKRQPGFISAQLHRGIGGSCVFMNYAVWESVAEFKRAFNQPGFQSHLKNYLPSAVASPHLFTKVAVPWDMWCVETKQNMPEMKRLTIRSRGDG